MSLDMANSRVNRITRYIRINEGNSDYASIPTVTLSGDFAIHFKFASTGGGHVFASSGSTDCRLSFNATAATLDIGDVEIFGGATININMTPFMNGELQSCVLRRVSGSVSLEVGGVQVGTSGTTSDAVQFDSIYKQWGGATGTPNWGGVLSDFAVVDAGTLVRSYAINGNSDTLVDEVGILGSELWDSPVLDANWSDNGGGSYTVDGLQGGFSGLTVNTTIGSSTRLLVSITVADKVGVGDLFFGASGTLRSLQNGTHNFIIDTGGDASKVQVIAESGVSATVSNISVVEADTYGVLVNGSDDDWGLFQEVSRRGNWQGSGLTVPPWASASQIIVVA
jgi:hypothetical protein